MLTLATLLQVLVGSTLTVDLHDDTTICGTLVSVDAVMKCARQPADSSDRARAERMPATCGSLNLSGVEICVPAQEPRKEATLQILGTAIHCVHLPGALDAPEMMRGRLRAIDQGRRSFRRRFKKAPPPRVPAGAQLEPIVSSNWTQVDAHGT